MTLKVASRRFWQRWWKTSLQPQEEKRKNPQQRVPVSCDPEDRSDDRNPSR
jgi:hypothetical protein